MNLAPLVDMTLLKRSLATSMSTWGGNCTRIIDVVTSNCESCSVLFLLFWLHAAHKQSTRGIFPAILGDVAFAYKFIVLVRFFILFPNPLAKCPNLFAEDMLYCFCICRYRVIVCTWVTGLFPCPLPPLLDVPCVQAVPFSYWVSEHSSKWWLLLLQPLPHCLESFCWHVFWWKVGHPLWWSHWFWISCWRRGWLHLELMVLSLFCIVSVSPYSLFLIQWIVLEMWLWVLTMSLKMLVQSVVWHVWLTVTWTVSDAGLVMFCALSELPGC